MDLDDLSNDLTEDLQNNLTFKDSESKVGPPGAYSDLKFEDDDDELPVFKSGQDLPEHACKYCGIHDPASVVFCNLCKKWFCNSRGSTSGTYTIFFVKSIDSSRKTLNSRTFSKNHEVKSLAV